MKRIAVVLVGLVLTLAGCAHTVCDSSIKSRTTSDGYRPHMEMCLDAERIAGIGLD